MREGNRISQNRKGKQEADTEKGPLLYSTNIYWAQAEGDKPSSVREDKDARRRREKAALPSEHAGQVTRAAVGPGGVPRKRNTTLAGAACPRRAPRWGGARGPGPRPPLLRGQRAPGCARRRPPRGNQQTLAGRRLPAELQRWPPEAAAQESLKRTETKHPPNRFTNGPHHRPCPGEVTQAAASPASLVPWPPTAASAILSDPIPRPVPLRSPAKPPQKRKLVLVISVLIQQ